MTCHMRVHIVLVPEILWFAKSTGVCELRRFQSETLVAGALISNYMS